MFFSISNGFKSEINEGEYMYPHAKIHSFKINPTIMSLISSLHLYIYHSPFAEYQMFPV